MEQLPETEIIQSRSSFITVDDYVLPHSHMSFLSQTIIAREILWETGNLKTKQECLSYSYETLVTLGFHIAFLITSFVTCNIYSRVGSGLVLIEVWVLI